MSEATVRLLHHEPPAFSVIMPSYALDSSLIERAIESVQRQTYESWELVYVDDNPADSEYKEISHRIAEKYAGDQRIRFIFHEDNMGANRARNDAIAVSTGDWLALLDADDSWEPRHLANVAAKISSVECALVSSSMRSFNGHGWRVFPHDHEDGMVYEEAVFGNIFGGSSCVCVRRDAMTAIGGFDDSLPACQDYDMFLRICKRYPVAFCSEATVNYSDEERERITSDMQKRVAGALAVLGKTLADEDLSVDFRESVRAAWYLSIGRMLLVDGEGASARKYLSQSTAPKAKLLYVLTAVAPAVPTLRRFVNRFRYR